jgi:hypothetical protein
MNASLTNWLHDAETRLSSKGFTISQDVSFDGTCFQMVAHRSRIELTKFGNCERFFVFANFDTLSEASLRQFAAKAFRYALAARHVPLPRGLFEAVYCFPVAIVAVLDPAIADSVRDKQPPKHWASAEIPAVYEHSTGKLYYFARTPLWGAAYYAGFRRQLRQFLEPH